MATRDEMKRQIDVNYADLISLSYPIQSQLNILLGVETDDGTIKSGISTLLAERDALKAKIDAADETTLTYYFPQYTTDVEAAERETTAEATAEESREPEAAEALPAEVTEIVADSETEAESIEQLRRIYS